jgi:HlyD family secretion protein
MMKKDLDGLRIEKSKKRNSSTGKGIWILLCLLLLVAVLFLVYRNFQLTQEVQTTSVAAADVPADKNVEDKPVDNSREVLIASGYVVAHHMHDLSAKVTGRVEWIGVEKGDRVEKGQLLVKLEDREFRANFDRDQAALKLAETRLLELEAGSRPEEIQRAKAELDRTKADRVNAKLELERLEKLLKNGVIAQNEVDNAKARFEMADAAVASADRYLELQILGPREERIAQARAEVEQAKAALAYSQAMLDATEIRAPISGTILGRIAEIGEMITTSFAGGAAVVAMADLSDLQVELDISQTDFNRISDEHECMATLEAFLDRSYDCAIDEISPVADRTKASIQVKVKILQPDEFMRPEMSARVTFLKKEDANE